MTKFYVSEAHLPWKPTNAQTLASAKRAARLMQRYQGTELWVSIGIESGAYKTIARLIVDALDMSDRGYWIDIE